VHLVLLEAKQDVGPVCRNLGVLQPNQRLHELGVRQEAVLVDASVHHVEPLLNALSPRGHELLQATHRCPPGRLILGRGPRAVRPPEGRVQLLEVDFPVVHVA